MQLTAVFQENLPEEGGGYTAFIQEVPAAISQGETLEDARANVLDALKLVLEANPDLALSLASPRRVIKELISVRVA